MRKILQFTILLMVSLFSVSRASAQFVNHHSIYVSNTLDNTHEYQTATISGYTQVSAPPGTPMVTATHKPVIKNQIGSAGGTYTGPGVCVSCTTNYTTPTAELAPIIDEIDVDAILFNMQCSIAGTFYTFNISQFIEYARTRATANGQPWYGCTGVTAINCDIPTINWCSNTETPDMNIAAVRSNVSPLTPPSFWDCYGLGIRPGVTGHFTFVPLTIYAIGLPSPSPTAACTANNT
jgi:hypothetical protein